MGIYIKGMEMPKDGELLCININPDGKVCINLDLPCKKVGTAVPVQPHGRLIDADAIPFIESDNGCQDDYAFRYDINEMQTIIPAEEGET